MENNTIKCPFCLKQSQKGVHVCTGWYAFVVILLTLGLSMLIGMSTGMAGATISIPIITAVGFVAGKAIFSDNVVFRGRMYRGYWRFYFGINK
ncbi:hypothetical protein [Rosenbergiella epipactidis]|uniref:hypothetical protein n=1 Tax=Rosenbergiella epipactidis TaxID=1544694 RepID=UPI001F4DD95E|nr:hypothetical protein [Rosenbergiella epipactidis]